jgi:hypothetical protein
MSRADALPDDFDVLDDGREVAHTLQRGQKKKSKRGSSTIDGYRGGLRRTALLSSPALTMNASTSA